MQPVDRSHLRAVSAPHGAVHQAHRADLQRPAAATVRPHSYANDGDRVEFSATGKGLYKLIRTWGALSQLFGIKQGQGSQPGIDLAAIQETIRQAQKNTQLMRERTGVMDMLKASALREAEALVGQYFGLQADGAPLQVALEKDMGGALASVSYLYGRDGRMEQQRLHINMKQFTPDSSPNGVNGHIIENDRIIAHELTHAIMGRSMNIRDLPDWFMEGTAEYIAGGMERVSLMLRHYSPAQLVARVAHPWEGDSSQYAAGYLAVRYMDEATQTGGGLKQIMQELRAGAGLDEALHTVSGGAYESVGDLLHEFAVAGEGQRFLTNLDRSGRDPGSIKPGLGPNIVPDQAMKSSQPLRGFRITWPSPAEGIDLGQGPAPWFLPTPFGAAAAYRRFQ